MLRQLCCFLIVSAILSGRTRDQAHAMPVPSLNSACTDSVLLPKHRMQRETEKTCLALLQFRSPSPLSLLGSRLEFIENKADDN